MIEPINPAPPAQQAAQGFEVVFNCAEVLIISYCSGIIKNKGSILCSDGGCDCHHLHIPCPVGELEFSLQESSGSHIGFGLIKYAIDIHPSYYIKSGN